MMSFTSRRIKLVQNIHCVDMTIRLFNKQRIIKEEMNREVSRSSQVKFPFLHAMNLIDLGFASFHLCIVSIQMFPSSEWKWDTT